MIEANGEAPSSCLLCGNPGLVRHFWPPIKYSGVLHRFWRCSRCRSLSMHPLPDEDCLRGIYEAVRPGLDNRCALPRHRRLQVAFLRDSRRWWPGTSLLDIGCGDGFYLRSARTLGLGATGVEFNAVVAARYRTATGLDILGWDDLAARRQRYDILHLGHVLEHMPDPVSLIERTLRFARPDTLWLVDGPLEGQACLSRLVVDLGSRIRDKPYNEMEPQHLIAATARGQELFFERIGFHTLRFEVREHKWPLPEHLASYRPVHVLMYAVAFASVGLSAVIPSLGNLFHFTGRHPFDAR